MTEALKGTSKDVPQANSVPKIRAVLAGVAGGAIDVESLKKATGLSQRHVHYYLHAARVLGWVSGQLGSLQVTARAQRLLASSCGSDEERSLMRADVEAMKIGPIIIPFLKGEIDVQDLAGRLSDYASLSTATARRRAGSLKRWRDYILGTEVGPNPFESETTSSGSSLQESEDPPRAPQSEEVASGSKEAQRSHDTGDAQAIDCERVALVLLLELDEIEWSVRAYNCFYAMKLRFVGDLVQCTPDRLLRHKNLGRTTLKEIESTLLRFGLALGMKLPSWELVDHDEVRRQSQEELQDLLDRVRRGEFVPDPRQLAVHDRADSPCDAEDMPALFLEVCDFDFSVRALNCFEVAGVRYVGDLVQLSRNQLLGQRNLGRKTVSEIESFLESLGLQLGMTLPGWGGLDHHKLSQATRHAQHEIVEALDDTPKPSTVEEEVALYLSEALRPKAAAIALARISWTGESDRTLADVGEEFGLSRERVRQIASSAGAGALDYRRGFRVLRSCLDRIESEEISDARAIKETLAAAGLIRQGTTLRAIRAAARMLQLPGDFELEQTPNGTFVVSAETKGISDRIAIEARRVTERWGCGRVDDIVLVAKDSLGVDISPEMARAVLATVPGLSWLDDIKTWFWVATVKRSRLLNNIDKILAVAPRITVSELRTAVRRHHRMDNFAPPRRILLALCSELEDCEVEGESVVDTGGRTVEAYLSDTERLLRSLILEHGPAVHVRTLDQLAIARGVNRATFQMTVFNSPVFRRLAKGVYGLVGADVLPSSVEEAGMLSTRRSKVLQDWGWASATVLRVDYRLSSGSISNGVLSIPAAARNVLSGDFALLDSEGAEIATLRVKSNQVWGFVGPFARQEPEPGDFLRIEFDIDKRVARIQIGSEPPEDMDESPTAVLVD